jgi:hypothetical protein
VAAVGEVESVGFGAEGGHALAEAADGKILGDWRFRDGQAIGRAVPCDPCLF